MSERKQQILQTAIELIANEGYAKLSLRAVARASGMKLGALQYHFANWEALLTSLADYILAEYRASLSASDLGDGELELPDLVAFFLDDAAGQRLHGDRLWPQLWAMGQVEPIMEKLLGEIYGIYLRTLEKALAALGSETPRAEALSLMSLIEGSTLFIGHGAPWAENARAVRRSVLEQVDQKYGKRRRPGRR